MTKKDKQNMRHARAEAFRNRITISSERAAAIRSLLSKHDYDEGDCQRINILLSKVSLASGCEQEYVQLVAHLSKNESFRDKAQSFFKRWHG